MQSQGKKTHGHQQVGEKPFYVRPRDRKHEHGCDHIDTCRKGRRKLPNSLWFIRAGYQTDELMSTFYSQTICLACVKARKWEYFQIYILLDQVILFIHLICLYRRTQETLHLYGSPHHNGERKPEVPGGKPRPSAGCRRHSHQSERRPA